MTNKLKKMLEPKYEGKDSWGVEVVGRQDLDRFKRGFLKLMEQRDCLIDSYYQTHDFRVRQREVDNAELEAAMKGEET